MNIDEFISTYGFYRHRPQIEPAFRDGKNINGCLPLDIYSSNVLETLQDQAVEFGTLWESGDMPVLRYNEAYRQWRDQRIMECEAIRNERITCTLPWQVLKYIPSQMKRSIRLYWSQGQLGSCMGHADAFAHHSATLQAIAYGSPLIYSSINPVVTWAITKGGSTWGGQSVSEMAAGANRLGHFTEEMVGEDNQRIPKNYRNYEDEAKRYQSSVLFLDFSGEELVEEIFACCQAGQSIAMGNSTAVSGSQLDENGVKVAVLSGRWAHATHFTSYRRTGGKEYIGWVNSHGDIYSSSDEEDPGDMCWMDKKTAIEFCSTIPQYGAPYVVFPEAPYHTTDYTLYVKYQIPWPKHWRF